MFQPKLTPYTIPTCAPTLIYTILTLAVLRKKVRDPQSLKVWSQYDIAYTVLTLRNFNYFLLLKVWSQYGIYRIDSWSQYGIYRIDHGVSMVYYRIDSNTFRSKKIINSTVIKLCSLRVKISNKK